MRVRRVGGILLAVVCASAVAAAALFGWWQGRGRPQREGVARIPGLSGPITVAFDDWGMPAVVAASDADLAAAQGWLHANDRFFQMELGRRAAAGRLSELFGERTVATDRMFRELRLRRTAERLLPALSEESRAWLGAYARGVNAWLEARGRDLPPELVLLKVAPEPWSEVDSLGFFFLMARDLSFWNGRPEEERFQWLAAFGPELARELLGDPDAHITAEIADLAAAAAGKLSARRGDAPTAPLASGPPGSNNFAIAPARSASGHAIVANDPHLALRLPNVWFQLALEAPGYRAAGMTLPGIPGVVLGRGDHLAWAMTNVMLDDHDVFFERLDERGERVERDGALVPIAVERESIQVKGGAPIELVLRSTDRGPLLDADPERGLPARSVAWTAYLPQDPLQALLGIARARSVDDIPAAVATYGCPAQNLLAADRDGHLLWFPIGGFPARRIGDGRFPAPGWLGAYGWDGTRPRAETPQIRDPQAGVFATANARVADEIHTPWLVADYDTPYRARRIEERLAAAARLDAAGLAAIQTDIVSLYAREMVAAWRAERPTDAERAGDAGRALAALAAWDGTMALEGPAALFALADREMQLAVFSDEAKAHHLQELGDRERLAGIFAGRLSSRWFDDVSTAEVETRETIVDRALERAWRQGVARWGADVATWRLGELQTLTLDHPLGSLPLLGRFFSRGPFPAPGSGTTVNATFAAWRGDRLDVAEGPSMRLVQDLGPGDATWSILPGGNSGHPFDPHYEDQLPLYRDGRLRAVIVSARDVVAAAKSRLILEPAAAD